MCLECEVGETWAQGTEGGPRGQEGESWRVGPVGHQEKVSVGISECGGPTGGGTNDMCLKPERTQKASII